MGLDHLGTKHDFYPLFGCIVSVGLKYKEVLLLFNCWPEESS